MAKNIDTAHHIEVEAPGGKITVQELSAMGAFRAANTIKKIVKKARNVGSLDALMESFRQTEGGTNIDRLLEALDMLLTVVGDEPELILGLVASCCVDKDHANKWTAELVGELSLDTLVDLMKATYQVNWVEGSLKKALGKLGMKFDEKASKNLPATPSEPSKTPAEETTSTPVEANIS